MKLHHHVPACYTAAALLVALVCAAPAGAGAGAAAQDEAAIDFSRDVLPVLSNNCFACHGPDDESRKAGLRLDRRESAMGVLKSGNTPQAPDRSELIRRITEHDPDEVMPPPKTGKKLTAEQIALLRRWIEQGAAYDMHWAFTPPQRAELPRVTDRGWPRNAIDHFILARLESEGLRPSDQADRITLLRRLSLDLIGLPPTPEEVDAFLADTSDQAWPKQVERLLASPHYGERWGRLWLDAARYADSDGYEKDKARTVWFYRDWVINAFNRDLRYDRFIIEQMAGDLIPGATQDQIVATGFLRNSMLNEEGGVDPEQFRMDGMFDRMDAIGKSMLGLTIQCAQCHTHKFDPLTQEAYYRMFAFINNDHEAMPTVYTDAQQERIAHLRRQMSEIEATMREQMPDWKSRMGECEQSIASGGGGGGDEGWRVLELTNSGNNAQRYYTLKDGSLLAAGWAPTRFNAEFEAKTELKTITALRIEALTDPNLPAGGPGRGYNGMFALSEMTLEAGPADGSAKPQKVKFSGATADFDQPQVEVDERFRNEKDKKTNTTGPATLAIDGDNNTAWSIDAGPGRRNTDRAAVFTLETPITFEAGATLSIKLAQLHGGTNANDFVTQNLGRFRISVTNATEAKADLVPRKVREILAIAPGERTEAQEAKVFSYWRTTVAEFAEANAAIEALWKQWPEGVTTYALKQRQEPRMTAVLSRGDWLKPMQEVEPGVPEFLHPLPSGGPDAPPNRLTFARWLADRDSPTTARVYVNRVWQAYFGAGLVETPEDFGLQGARPSHPELLDWLACEFMDSGWSIKHLHRLIVNSATYRQSSRVTPELLERDPYNRLLARGPRLRVDAEIVRDITLAASGLLNRQIGGRSIMPPAPAFLFLPPASYGDFPWTDETDAQKYRRGVYTFRRRSTPYPPLLAFDAPTGDFSCVRRSRSNTPMQALTTLNEPLFVEAAQALALLTVREGGDSDAARVEFAFRRCVSRAPETFEREELLALLDRTEDHFQGPGRESEAWKLATLDPAHPPELPEGVDAAKLAAWTAVCRVLLNLDETITKE